jgi:hypothetical protein
MTLVARIEDCRREIAARADGFLTFRTRRAMLHAIGSTWVPDEEEGWGQEMLDEPEDPDFFDCAAWAAAAAAGDFPWTEQKQWFSPDKSRAFWSWYLDSAVPEALKHLSP